MRVLIIGAGAVGCYLGALLARAGKNVSLVARGGRAEALRTHGVHLESKVRGTFDVQLPIVSSLAEAASSSNAPFELVAIAVKSPNLDEVATELGRQAGALLAADATVISLLNDLDGESVLVRQLPAHGVIGGVVHVGVEARSAWQIVHTSGAEILFAPADPAQQQRARAAAEFFASAGIEGGYRDDLRLLRWRKMIWNGYNAVTALTNTTVDEATKHAALRPLLEASMRETAAVAAAEGVALPGAVVSATLFQGERCVGQRTSMLQDVLLGRPTEHATLNGRICELARHHGLATPVNDLLHALLAGRNVTGSR